MNLLKTSILFISLLLVSCEFPEFPEGAGANFGDQHFKTAISLIELHKIREDEYPQSLEELKYLGDWDQMIFTSLSYSKLGNGYELNLSNAPFGGADKLEYPADFWKGLGLVKTNVMKKE